MRNYNMYFSSSASFANATSLRNLFFRMAATRLLHADWATRQRGEQLHPEGVKYTKWVLIGYKL